ncbi:hypothetical protein LMH87_011307 [Akanthomyces muscarius]|uniref:ABC transporter domain-containing protein n=1 Tax=Akanthomyces muscarius TaxID=2231603 RepID=A0A9W8UJU2_AKAMU|nr:hypothetical protein LMH87_011307 [Akanthomyces muscarius]KAJ4150562.1 hypothetical protein LMH87_011307 [Akanthomyces muscarius]
MSGYGLKANADGTPAGDGVPFTSPNLAHHGDVADDMFDTRLHSPADTLHMEEDTETVEMSRRASAVQALASTFSRDGHYENPFHADKESPLNPSSPNFNAREWAKSMVQMNRAGQDDDRAGFRAAGVAFQHLNIHGYGSATDYQKTVLNTWLSLAGLVTRFLPGRRQSKIEILRDFDGHVHPGEMLLVLGPPGAGCSTFLKTVSGEMNGIYADDGSYFNYRGMDAREMHTRHRGEAIYTAEVDVHFPQLTVGDTLGFAARARQPRNLPPGVDDRARFANHLRDVVMAMFGIAHTVDTRVGNEYVRGVSGGERKRVTIAEAALSGAPLQAWDNSTRGLDSANAIEFCRTLRLQTELFRTTACVSIYQAPQAAYALFDKTLVIYEGRQIYFGSAAEAKQYFVSLGYECPARQTTPDFLTSMTSPIERRARPGWESRVPRTPDDFAAAWKASREHKALQAEIEQYKVDHPIDGPDAEAFRASKRAQQAKSQREGSPFTLSYLQQVQLCLWRGWLRLSRDPGLVIGAIIGNFITALIVGSVFYNLPESTSSFFQRGVLLFFACLINAFGSALEILTLYAQRPIVEKHARYALYHPSAEAISSMICDLPYKLVNGITFNVTLYFMTNLRREPGSFFFFLLISYTVVLVTSMLFRTVGSASRSLFQALVPTALIIIGLVMFTGFALPRQYMLGWSKWITWIDPLSYAFEALIVNEFHGRDFPCDNFIPQASAVGYENVGGVHRVCNSIGALQGAEFVNGDRYSEQVFSYSFSHRWRNFGIVCAFIVFFLFTYLIAAELVSEAKSKGEVLLYPRSRKPAFIAAAEKNGDAETGAAHTGSSGSSDSDADAVIQRQTAIFQWHDVCYEVKIKKETRRILDHVDGWVKPGTLTALMGVSGAGKTTLLDCLADRTSMGIITGEMLVDGKQRDMSFQRKTGYVQQQDLHLPTSTVREALSFSALLRQPGHVPRAEKLAYVDEVIKLLDMQDYADAVVGVPGEGLNVEQRKRLTIGVELAAKPPLLLFVDEPTSGLDSQTSWAILNLLEKLTKAGQAVLCTIHQPSAMLFQRFDRLLFLAKGGKTVYFGDIGENSSTMVSYFEGISGLKCPDTANPAEWMLEAIGAAPGSHTDVDWHAAWRASPEYEAVQAELERIKAERASTSQHEKYDAASYREFAAPFSLQLRENLVRVFQQYWRQPTYIYSKASLCVLVALFVGFVFFMAKNSMQGLQNQMFAVFQLLTVFGQIVQQSMPQFIIQRDLYEVRERPAKAYSWVVFMLSQILVEIPWNALMGVFMYFCWYYPVGMYRNAEPTDAVHERGALMFLYLVVFMIFSGTFSTMVISPFETAEAGGNVSNLFYTMMLIFCGVISTKEQLPAFWRWMLTVSPFRYMVSGLLSTGVANTVVVCADNEILVMQPYENQTCQQYLGAYASDMGGSILNGGATSDCQFCPYSTTNGYLANLNSYYSDRWTYFGVIWIYVAFNIAAALFFYWLARVPKNKFKKGEESQKPVKKSSEKS